MLSGYDALRTAAAWLDLSARGRIYVTGEDRARLLHALTTNHVEQLTPGMGCYAFFLNAQGHILADVNLLCLEDRFLLDTEPETRDLVLRHLDKYIIADDVTLEDVTGSLACIAVEGPGGAGLQPANSFPNAITQPVSSTGEPGFRIYVPVGDKLAWIARLESAGAQPASAEEARTVRLEHGIPRYGEDIFDTTLPQETRQLHAIHFAKGCYLGQEIVERIRSRGHVNRLLAKLEIEGEKPLPAGTKVYAGDAEVGEITSSAFSPALGKVVALAYLRAQYAEPGTPLRVAQASACCRELYNKVGQALSPANSEL
jgi:aminomethyltransferase